MKLPLKIKEQYILSRQTKTEGINVQKTWPERNVKIFHREEETSSRSETPTHIKKEQRWERNK